MSDLGSGLLAAALEVADVQLRDLVQLEPAALVAVLAPGLDPAPAIDAAQAARAETERRLAVSAAALTAAAQDLAMAQEAVRSCASTIAAVADGCAAVAAALPSAGTPADVLVRLGHELLRRATIATDGLLHQLSLSLRDADMTVRDGAVVYHLAGDGDVDVAPGVVLRAVSIDVELDHAEPRLGAAMHADVAVTIEAGPLSALLPTGIKANSHVSVGVDSVDGVTVGERQRRVVLPVASTTPGIALPEMSLGVTDGQAGLAVLTRVVLDVSAGVAAEIAGTGLAIDFDPATATPIQVTSIEPTGVAVRIDAGIVRGGGVLARHETTYVGMLELTIGPISARAVVLLGTAPFSLVALFFAEFTAPIQLSFGFTLNGIGGLLAVDRTVARDELQRRMWDGTADALLFPDHHETPDTGLLEAVFPTRGGGVAIGPAFELGWGSPISLLVAKVGVVLVLPDPSIVVIGKLRVAVPSPALPIVDLNVRVYGEITADHVLVIAGLSGSRIAGFTLSGDFGLYIGYGTRPSFAVSAGGFHPRFAPPAPLAGLRRITVDMSPPALLTLRAEAYLALTSNAFMIGARVEAGIDFGVASAHGMLAFDALVLWDPMHFEIDLVAAVEVEVAGLSVMGVGVALHLEGPGRWRVHGTASIDFLFLPTLHLEVNPAPWGDTRVEQNVEVSPVDLVLERLRDRASWQPRLPAGADRLVSFSDRPVSDTSAVLVHPLGGFEVRQTLVPLDTDLHHYGGYRVSVRRVGLGLPIVGGTAASTASVVRDLFAVGQFRHLTDDEKLAPAAYEQLPSGVSFAATPIAFGPSATAELSWRTVYPHQPLEESDAGAIAFEPSVMPHLLAMSAAGRYRSMAGPNPYATAGGSPRLAMASVTA